MIVSERFKECLSTIKQKLIIIHNITVRITWDIGPLRCGFIKAIAFPERCIENNLHIVRNQSIEMSGGSRSGRFSVFHQWA